MKLKIEESRRATWLACMVVGLTVAASADVIRQTISYPSNAIAAWASIDFDGDTTSELSFESYGIGNESGGVMFLDVHGSQSTQVLLQDWRVLPLQLGDTVSLTPVMGQWQTTGLRNSVWTTGLVSSPEAPSPPPGQGVGMPGYGDFMGVRFLDGIEWHYAWVRFGPLNASLYPGWPSVLEYAYETFPNTPVLVPEPSAYALILSGCALLSFHVRRKGMALTLDRMRRSAIMFMSQFGYR
jgi:hypothetical protein